MVWLCQQQAEQFLNIISSGSFEAVSKTSRHFDLTLISLILTAYTPSSHPQQNKEMYIRITVSICPSVQAMSQQSSFNCSSFCG